MAGPSQASELASLAIDHYTFGVSTSGEPFARLVDGSGPAHIAHVFRGNRFALRPRLAALYRQAKKTTPNQSALADALLVLEGLALEGRPTELHLRGAPYEDGIIVDRGDPDGRVFALSPHWSD